MSKPVQVIILTVVFVIVIYGLAYELDLKNSDEEIAQLSKQLQTLQQQNSAKEFFRQQYVSLQTEFQGTKTAYLEQAKLLPLQETISTKEITDRFSSAAVDSGLTMDTFVFETVATPVPGINLNKINFRTKRTGDGGASGQFRYLKWLSEFTRLAMVKKVLITNDPGAATCVMNVDGFMPGDHLTDPQKTALNFVLSQETNKK